MQRKSSEYQIDRTKYFLQWSFLKVDNAFTNQQIHQSQHFKTIP